MKIDWMDIRALERFVQICAQINSMTPEVLSRDDVMEILWIAERLHMRKYARPLAYERYYANCNGINNVNVYRDDLDNFIRECNSCDLLSDSRIDVLKDAWDIFADHKKAHPDEKLSKKYPEWYKHKAVFDKYEDAVFVVNWLDFFENPDSDDPYFKMEQEHLDVNMKYFIDNYPSMVIGRGHQFWFE